MDLVAVYNNYYYYIKNNSIYYHKMGNNNSTKVDDIAKGFENETFLAYGKLFYVDNNRMICSYDVETFQKNILSHRVSSSVTIYGDHIFYVSDGLYAMNLDGSNQNRITDAFVYNYEIYDDYIFIINESRNIYRIDLNNNSYSNLIQGENIMPPRNATQKTDE